MEQASGAEQTGSTPFPNRRGFLRAAGFSFAGAVLAGCGRAPVEKAVPYLAKPEEITPGRALWYATTCGGCPAGCGVLVKNRDGRPIKLEGNPDHPLSRGGLCAVGQASILGLYDVRRLKHPLRNGGKASWEEVDREITARLNQIRRSGGAVRFLSGTITSPTLQAAIDRFLGGFPGARHIVYDPLSCSAILDAHERTHGIRLLPRYRFERAEVIAAFDADFLGTWISPVEYTQAYRQRRTPPDLSYHVQFEGRMSLTGSKADRRVLVAPDEIGPMLRELAELLRGGSTQASPLGDLAERLRQARGRSLVVCGSQDVDVQVVCNSVNHLLGNYGATIDIEAPSRQKQGNDRELERLLAELEAGKVAALFVYGVNPAAELPRWPAVPLLISFAERLDETASVAHYVCPDHHYLESWGDAEPVSGIVSLSQPVIHPLGDTRAVAESLAVWSGRQETAYDLVRQTWEPRVESWDRAVHDGCIPVAREKVAVRPFNPGEALSGGQVRPPGDSLQLVLYPKVGMFDGRHAYNPWLHELPDPITKVTWDNYACLSPLAAERLGVREGDVVRVEAGGRGLELPAFVQPGQHDRVVAVALGYGRKASERFARIGPEWLYGKPSVGENGRVGKNAEVFIELSGGALRYSRGPVKLAKTGRRVELACTQTHHTLTVPKHLAPASGEVRPVIQETTLAEFRRDPHASRRGHEPPKEDLWPPDHRYTGHRWVMAIDLNACTGCAACVIACQVENNIPVVGKDEVRRKREMHWIRIDRYYSGAGADVEVAHQPMMCQQCEHAPCETVCPVLATVHSAEGLNQQVYNRCVGTRYCANNCPYKARRFNWFDYPRNERLENLVLNPDVTVRSRGVMEKCTFCVQRIQEAKIEAKQRGERLEDGAVQPACQQSCPARAIVFGDANDPKSRVAQLLRDPRSYRVLEEINVRPSVAYLRLVRNREEKRHG